MASASAVAGSAEAQHLAELATITPVLHAYDRIGERLDEVAYHPAYHQLMEWSAGQGLTFGAFPSREPAIWREPPASISPPRWRRPLLPCHHDQCGAYPGRLRARRRPLPAAPWCATTIHGSCPPLTARLTFGMGMTERRRQAMCTNTTRAVPAGDHHLIHGEKWFMSAPMSDAFLILAQAPAGLSRSAAALAP